MTGSVRLTASGVVGVSGKPVRVHSVELLSGGTAGKLTLRNGTADTDTVYVDQTCATVSETNTFTWVGGLVFPDGCYFHKDANTTAVVVNFEQIAST
jgi:hypothetical protein